MNEELSDKQKVLLKLFYSKGKTKVIYRKSKRNKFWKKVTNRDILSETEFLTLKTCCPAMLCEINKTYESENLKNNIQSAVFSECVYAQTLANMFGLEFVPKSDCNDIPEDAQKYLKEHCMHARYYYTNKQKNVFLFQAGSCSGVDCGLWLKNDNDCSFYTIEFKESYAKSSEPDLPEYGENGILVVDDKFLKMYPHFKPMLDEKSGLNFFEVMGSNIHGFSEMSVRTAVDSNYVKKQADVIVTEGRNGILIMLPSNHISKWARIHGEIRPAGRNSYRVWTPNKAKEFIVQKDGKIENNIVTIEKSKLEERAARGNKKRVSGYKITPVIFVKTEACSDTGGTICFEFDDLRQLKPTIAGIIDFKDCCYDTIKSAYKDLY